MQIVINILGDMYSSIPACLYPLPTVGLQGKADGQNNFIIKRRKEINKKKTEHPKGKIKILKLERRRSLS